MVLLLLLLVLMMMQQLLMWLRLVRGRAWRAADTGSSVDGRAKQRRMVRSIFRWHIEQRASRGGGHCGRIMSGAATTAVIAVVGAAASSRQGRRWLVKVVVQRLRVQVRSVLVLWEAARAKPKTSTA
jgi:hypothetical protein